MSRNIPAKLRREVAQRAHSCCEYCLAFEGHSFIKFQIEHIISLKHGGPTELPNLAYSCFFCNNHKGTDLATILAGGELVRFYHPRKDQWGDHFELDGPLILPKSKIAEGTIKILRFNEEERVRERLAFMEAGFFPHENAMKLIE